MNIGISGLATDHGDIGLLAQKIEELGFESIWLPEHPVIPVIHDTKYACYTLFYDLARTHPSAAFVPLGEGKF